MKGKVSVIVPIYNVENYLTRCIESIINQTYKNLEILLVDDGSLDKSGEICDVYSLKDSRIKVIHKENGGLSDARNTGLDYALGEYVSFIDSDDYIHERYFEILVNLMIGNDADIVQCELLKVYGDNHHEVGFKEKFAHANGEATVLSNIEALNNLYNEHYVSTVVVTNKLYKTELFNDTRFPKGKIHEDEFTTYSILYHSTKVVMTTLALYYYFQRPNSITTKKFNINRFDILEAYANQVSFYHKKKLVTLKKEAIKALEDVIKSLMYKVLKSDMDNKQNSFRYLVHYYREYFHLFKSETNIRGMKRMQMYLYHYSPILLIKWVCKVLMMRVAIVQTLKQNHDS